MPAEPIIESIARELENTLNAINTQDGFFIDLRAQRRRRKNEVDDGVCLIHLGVKHVDALTTGASAGIVYWRQRVMLQIYVLDSDKAEDAPDRRIAYVCADVERKLMEDPTRGGNAHLTELDSAEPFLEAPNGHPGVLIAFDVLYACFETDPTQIE